MAYWKSHLDFSSIFYQNTTRDIILIFPQNCIVKFLSL